MFILPRICRLQSHTLSSLHYSGWASACPHLRLPQSHQSVGPAICLAWNCLAKHSANSSLSSPRFRLSGCKSIKTPAWGFGQEPRTQTFLEFLAGWKLCSRRRLIGHRSPSVGPFCQTAALGFKELVPPLQFFWGWWWSRANLAHE